LPETGSTLNKKPSPSSVLERAFYYVGAVNQEEYINNCNDLLPERILIVG